MAEPNSHRPFAWAGWQLAVPASLRPFRIEGRYHKGDLGLGDEYQPRLELAWRWPKRRRFDPHRMLRHHLVRVLPRHQRREADRYIRALDSEHFAPLLRYTDAEQKLDRCAGFARRTGRLAEAIVHYRDGERPDEELIADVAATLRDQPLDAPQRWAFFDHRLTVPADYLYDSCQLNLGDMGVRFRHRQWPALSFTLRLIYTARLALQRCGLATWMAHVHREDRITGDNTYRMPGTKTEARGDTIQTRLGPALTCDSRLRWNVRMVRWKLPARQRHWLIHDAERDRLIYIRVGDAPERFEPMLHVLLDGMDWHE